MRLRCESRHTAEDSTDCLEWLQKSIGLSSNYIHTLEESVESGEKKTNWSYFADWVAIGHLTPVCTFPFHSKIRDVPVCPHPDWATNGFNVLTSQFRPFHEGSFNGASGNANIVTDSQCWRSGTVTAIIRNAFTAPLNIKLGTCRAVNGSLCPIQLKLLCHSTSIDPHDLGLIFFHIFTTALTNIAYPILWQS